jgi:hypothetical protein
MELMDVEALAVSEIHRLVARCPHLKAYISMNDKTPFTDGHIDLYDGLGRTKADWQGRVPVQVKGRTRQPGDGAPTHPLTRTDLLAYARDSGVLYFYVVVEGSRGECTPYYKLLSPFAIDSILRDLPESQAQVSVQMNPVPDDVAGLERLVALALKTRDQNTSLGFDPVLFERAKSFTVHAASNIDFDAPVVLTPGVTDFALVLNTIDGLSIPLDGELSFSPADFVERELDVQTSSGGYTFDGAVTKRVSQTTVEVRLSEGLQLAFNRQEGRLSAQVHLTSERRLSGRLKALGFCNALIDTKVLYIDGNAVPIEITQEGDESWIRAHFEYLRWLNELLEHLGVNTSLIEPDEIDEAQVRQLKVLHRAFVKGEEVTDASATTSRVLQKVGQWRLMFLLAPGSAPDKWRCVDPFLPEARQQFRWAAGVEDAEQESIPVTAYDVLEDEHVGTVVNTRLADIVGAYEAISDFPSTFAVANQRVLALIHAADACEQRKGELLGAAALLNDWLLAEDGGVSHHRINKWQIDARRSGLTKGQRSEIRDLKRQIVRAGDANKPQAEVACAILLGDSEEVEDLLRLLDEQQLKQLKTWPIWTLWTDGTVEGSVDT